MKPFLFTLLLVLWGLPQAGAEELGRSDLYNFGSVVCGPTVFDRRCTDAKSGQVIENPLNDIHACLAKMEAAMRAMEPFIDNGVAGPDLRGNDRFHMELWPKHAIEAFKQWELAKACWQKERP